MTIVLWSKRGLLRRNCRRVSLEKVTSCEYQYENQFNTAVRSHTEGLDIQAEGKEESRRCLERFAMEEIP